MSKTACLRTSTPASLPVTAACLRPNSLAAYKLHCSTHTYLHSHIAPCTQPSIHTSLHHITLHPPVPQGDDTVSELGLGVAAERAGETEIRQLQHTIVVDEEIGPYRRAHSCRGEGSWERAQLCRRKYSDVLHSEITASSE